MYIKRSLKWISDYLNYISNVEAEHFVCLITLVVCLIVVNEEKPRETTGGFKESWEAAINVIPTLGFSVKETGDLIPILKLIPMTVSCFFVTLFPKGSKAASAN